MADTLLLYVLIYTDSGNDLVPIRHQAITWTNDDFITNDSSRNTWIPNHNEYEKYVDRYIAVFYLKFFEHPSFGQVAHEIYPSEWKVHSSEISITIMYCWYMFLMAVATDFTHVTINLVCCCLSPVLISHKRSCWKISQSLKPIWLDVEMLVPLFF